MRNVVFCLITLLALQACKKDHANNNQSGSVPFPNKVGDRWVYQVNDTGTTISQYKMTVTVTDSIQLPGAIKANVWVYTYPGGSDTNYVYQHGDTVSFFNPALHTYPITREYVLPFTLQHSWRYVPALLPNDLHDVTVDSSATIIAGDIHFENAKRIRGIPGVPDNFFYLEEWVADHTGIVSKYFNNQGFTTGPVRKKRWTLLSYQLK